MLVLQRLNQPVLLSRYLRCITEVLYLTSAATTEILALWPNPIGTSGNYSFNFAFIVLTVTLCDSPTHGLTGKGSFDKTGFTPSTPNTSSIMSQISNLNSILNQSSLYPTP
jgi:hypothetical protein